MCKSHGHGILTSIPMSHHDMSKAMTNNMSVGCLLSDDYSYSRKKAEKSGKLEIKRKVLIMHYRLILILQTSINKCTVCLGSRCRSGFKTREFRFDYLTNMIDGIEKMSFVCWHFLASRILAEILSVKSTV